MKTFSHGLRILYLRDKDGALIHKTIENQWSCEEVTSTVFSPPPADCDSLGFELSRIGRKARQLYVFDLEGEKRLKFELLDVLRYNTHILGRDLLSDGTFWKNGETVLSAVSGMSHNPLDKSSSYLADFFDISIQNSNLINGNAQNQEIPGPNLIDDGVGCNDSSGWCPPEYQSCVDCDQGGGGSGGGPGGGGGGGTLPTFECSATLSGSSILYKNQIGYFNMLTDCPSPYNITWSGGNGFGYNTLNYSTSWSSPGQFFVAYSFSTSKSVQIPNTNDWTIVVKGVMKQIGVSVVEPPEPARAYALSVQLSPSNIQPFGRTTVVVTVLDQNFIPFPNCLVRLSVNEVQNTGGHFHSGRPLGQVTKTSGTTNTSGVFSTYYNATGISGNEEIIAQVAGLPEQSAIVKVKYGGLVNMSAGTDYMLVGGGAAFPAHPNNHYGTPLLISALQMAATAYQRQFPGSGLLGINDMSLIWGGLFDCDITWAPPHDEHRFGRNCDLPFRYIPPENREALETIFTLCCLTFSVHNGNHYHVTI